jgi:CheY-like chemotaxis protein
MAARVLVESGFRVLECAHPDRALEYAQSYAGEIALLLTDVVMPDVNGVQLASRILPLRPAMKLVFMSGYSEHAAVDEACLQLGAVYLAKPFTPDDLRAGVFEALAARNGGGTILLVNDEPPVRKVLSEFLTGAGYRVLEAATGADAIKQARVTPVDLMITDLSMPHQEGLETIQQLHREQPQLKMIAISGRFARPMLRAAERFGAKASIGKPVRRDELLQTVSRVFQGDSK